MPTCIPSRELKGSWLSCARRVNAGNKNIPSVHHPRRRNATTLMVGLTFFFFKWSHTQKSYPQNGEPQRHSWATQKKIHHGQDFTSPLFFYFICFQPAPFHNVFFLSNWFCVSSNSVFSFFLLFFLCVCVGFVVVVVCLLLFLLFGGGGVFFLF